MCQAFIDLEARWNAGSRYSYCNELCLCIVFRLLYVVPLLQLSVLGIPITSLISRNIGPVISRSILLTCGKGRFRLQRNVLEWARWRFGEVQTVQRSWFFPCNAIDKIMELSIFRGRPNHGWDRGLWEALYPPLTCGCICIRRDIYSSPDRIKY